MGGILIQQRSELGADLDRIDVLRYISAVPNKPTHLKIQRARPILFVYSPLRFVLH
jgi:hypothetical protein